MVSDGFWEQVDLLCGREGTVDRGDSGWEPRGGKTGKREPSGGARVRGLIKQNISQHKFY